MALKSVGGSGTFKFVGGVGTFLGEFGRCASMPLLGFASGFAVPVVGGAGVNST
jgi:hypothetical protein